ncbi:MAG: EAL domain-containing protein [Lachnospiraceae bacterium]|nr:EAL domain-containing protein [Lachnospiraceae bacterium]
MPRSWILTGLYNKEYFTEYAHVYDQYYPDRKMDAVALNINRFHILNEIYGRTFGNELLLMIGRAINEYVSKCDGIACRYDADGYFLYIPGGHDIPGELSKVIKEYETDDMRNIHIRVRFGIYPDVDREYDVLRRFDCALLACNSIKDDYKERVAFYDSSMHEREAYSERLMADMEPALIGGQFRVYYQPKYDIQSDKPRLSSAEALIRWVHPTLGMISPSKFIPIFEANGMIRRLDRYVWREAARQIAEWKKEFGFTISVSVNVSRIDLMELSFIDEITGIMEETCDQGTITASYKRPIDVRNLISDLKVMLNNRVEYARRKSILLVDDDIDFLQIAYTWFDGVYDVDFVNSAKEAIKYLSGKKPDLIFFRP